MHLRQAHWRAPPQRRSIPAVRAPTADDDAGMSGATRSSTQLAELAQPLSELLANGDPQAPVLIDSWVAIRPLVVTLRTQPPGLRLAGRCPSADPLGRAQR